MTKTVIVDFAYVRKGDDTMGKRKSPTGGGSQVRLSVSLDAEVWKRLRALVIVRETSIQDLVVGLVTREVARVRLPFETGESGHAD